MHKSKDFSRYVKKACRNVEKHRISPGVSIIRNKGRILEKMPFTYMLQCADGSFYTGWTTDLEARLKVHNEGKGARYTRSRLPVQLVYWETQPGRSEAQRREAFIRKLKRKQKEQLIKSFNAP